MTEKLAGQILFLRKQKGLTQEDLASALGVSGQAVSKWESAQCCPDITLLPKIASLFEVSIDELMGYKTVASEADYFLGIRNKIASLPHQEARAFALRMARNLHAVLFMKENQGRSKTWNEEVLLEQAGKGEWGYSCSNTPDLTSCMWQGSLFFSDNKNLGLHNVHIKNITAVMKAFGDMRRMEVATALYRLTVHDENAYVSADTVSQKCGIAAEAIIEMFENDRLA